VALGSDKNPLVRWNTTLFVMMQNSQKSKLWVGGGAGKNFAIFTWRLGADPRLWGLSQKKKKKKTEEDKQIRESTISDKPKPHWTQDITK